MSIHPIGRIEVYTRELLCERRGYCVVWDLLRLYGEIGLTVQGGKAWRWACHSWKTWQAYLVDDVGLSLSHLGERDPSSRDEAGGHMPSEQQAEWRGVSTIALFALLIRMAYGGRQALRSSSDRSVVLALLTSILKAWLGGRMLTFTLFLSNKPVWSPPRLPESSENFAAGPASCACLAVSDGNISLKPLLDARSPDLVGLQKLVKPIVFGATSRGVHTRRLRSLDGEAHRVRRSVALDAVDLVLRARRGRARRASWSSWPSRRCAR
jgi:hypothetical protein